MGKLGSLNRERACRKEFLMTRIFITHSTADLHFAKQLFRDLQARGFELWLDDKSLQPGHRIAEEINQGLAWCDLYLPIISNQAFGSPWCGEEINAAINLSNQRHRAGRPTIIPILIENCERELAEKYPSLAARLYITFDNSKYNEALRKLVTKILESPAQNEPLVKAQAPKIFRVREFPSFARVMMLIAVLLAGFIMLKVGGVGDLFNAGVRIPQVGVVSQPPALSQTDAQPPSATVPIPSPVIVPPPAATESTAHQGASTPTASVSSASPTGTVLVPNKSPARPTSVPLSPNRIKIENPNRLENIQTLRGHTDSVLSLRFSPDGLMLASASLDKTVRLWRVSDGNMYKVLSGHKDVVYGIDYSPDNQVLVSGSNDETIRIWRASDGELLRTIVDSWPSGGRVSVSPDGTMVASASFGPLRIWRISDGALVRILDDQNKVGAVAFSPNGDLLASGGFDNSARLWRVSDGMPIKTFSADGFVEAVTFSPDGSLLATGSSTGKITLWRVQDGSVLRALTGHTKRIWSLAFSPDGSLLASASWDMILRLWRVDNGDSLRAIQDAAVESVSFSPDQAFLATGSAGGKILLWGIVP